MTLRNFTKLPVLRYLDSIFVMYYIYGVSVPSLLNQENAALICVQTYGIVIVAILYFVGFRGFIALLV